MRHLNMIWLVVLAMSGSASAQTPATEIPAEAAAAVAAETTGVSSAQPAADAPVHDELRALQKAMEDALNSRDLDGLLAHVDEQVTFTAMNAQTGVGKQGIREYFDRMLNGPNKIVESIEVDFVPDALAVFYGPDVAVSTGNADSHYVLTNGMNFKVMARWTATLVRKDGKWLVAAFHYSTNMFKNPVLDAQRKWLMIAGGGVALLLGVIGFFVGRKTGRRTG
jgi:uncharacterized protein (TIGR02246 family)